MHKIELFEIRTSFLGENRKLYNFLYKITGHLKNKVTKKNIFTMDITKISSEQKQIDC